MQIGRDLVDKQVLDREERKMGKVDDVVIVLRRGRTPRVAAIELGVSTLLHRIYEGLGRISSEPPVRIDLDRVEKAGINVQADVDANQTHVYDWERWVRRVFIWRIPGHGSGGPEEEKK